MNIEVLQLYFSHSTTNRGLAHHRGPTPCRSSGASPFWCKKGSFNTAGTRLPSPRSFTLPPSSRIRTLGGFSQIPISNVRPSYVWNCTSMRKKRHFLCPICWEANERRKIGSTHLFPLCKQHHLRDRHFSVRFTGLLFLRALHIVFTLL